MTASNADYVIVSKAEYELRKGEIEFTPQDMQELVEYRDVFIKYIDKRMHMYRANLAMLRYKAEEVAKVYVYIEELANLKKTIEESLQEYKKYVDTIEKDKKGHSKK